MPALDQIEIHQVLACESPLGSCVCSVCPLIALVYASPTKLVKTSREQGALQAELLSYKVRQHFFSWANIKCIGKLQIINPQNPEQGDLNHAGMQVGLS